MPDNVVSIDDARRGAQVDDWIAFSALAGLTADLLPVVSNQRAPIAAESKLKELGKTPSRYNRNREVVGIADWTSYQATLDDVDHWQRIPDYGICLQTREVRAIDVDVPDRLRAAAILRHISGRLFAPVRARSNSSKFLLAFRLPGSYTKRRFKTEGGLVEFLATGQQFVAAGTHPSGVRYEWEGGTPTDFPTLTPEQFEELWQSLVEAFAVEDPTTASASVKGEKLHAAIENDPVAQFLINGHHVKAIDHRSARLFITCPFEAEHTTESNDSATAYFPAHTGGYANGHFECLHAHCQSRSDQSFLDALSYVDADASDAFAALCAPDAPRASPAAEIGEPATPFAFQLLRAHEVVARAPTRWLVKGVLPQAELGVLYGDSGSGKSFLALDMSGSIARQREWRGHRVAPAAARVIIVAAEGGGGFQARLAAYCQAHQIAPDQLNVRTVIAAPNLLDRKVAVELARAIQGQGGADLIWIDTAAAVTPGANENASEDVGRLIAHCKGLHRATGALVMLIHHSGKDATRGARGWSGLRAACDVEMEVSRDGDDRVLTITKQKDGEDGQQYGFHLRPVQIGVDEDGDPIGSCVVEPAHFSGTSQRKKPPKGDIQRLALRKHDEMASLIIGEAGVDELELRNALIADLPAPEEGKRDRRSYVVDRALISLLAAGQLFKQGHRLLTQAPDLAD